ncbi:MAG: hypothetical protein OCU12_07745 [Methanophagales archaeon]|nr:hypothetical protein [Methanophagales archaeon]
MIFWIWRINGLIVNGFVRMKSVAGLCLRPLNEESIVTLGVVKLLDGNGSNVTVIGEDVVKDGV